MRCVVRPGVATSTAGADAEDAAAAADGEDGAEVEREGQGLHASEGWPKSAETAFEVLQRGFFGLRGPFFGWPVARVRCRPLTGAAAGFLSPPIQTQTHGRRLPSPDSRHPTPAHAATLSSPHLCGLRASLTARTLRLDPLRPLRGIAPLVLQADAIRSGCISLWAATRSWETARTPSTRTPFGCSCTPTSSRCRRAAR